MSFRGDGTRPGARDGVSPPLAPSQGCEQETTTAETTGRRHEAGRQSLVSPPSLAPSQGCEWGTTTAETTGRRHEAGRQSLVSPPSRSQSGMRVGDDLRRDDGATGRGQVLGMESPLLSLPVRDASRRRRPQT